MRAREYLEATRPWSFSMTAISVTLGSLLALRRNGFHWGLFAAVLVGMILAHAATNMINDYFDVRHGVDTPDSPTARYRRHPLIEGILTPRQLLMASASCYAISAAIGVYLAVARGWILLAFVAAGGLASLLYTGGPVRYKHRGLGEVSVFLMWGPLVVLGAYYVQTGNWIDVGMVALVSVPQGIWVALVLLANNLKDLDFDRDVGVATLATGLGRRGALFLYALLMGLAYAICAVEILLEVMPLWALLVLLSLPLSTRLILALYRAESIPADADPRTAQIGMLFGVLLVAGIGIGFLLSAS